MFLFIPSFLLLIHGYNREQLILSSGCRIHFRNVILLLSRDELIKHDKVDCRKNPGPPCLRRSGQRPQCLVLNHSYKHTFMNLFLDCSPSSSPLLVFLYSLLVDTVSSLQLDPPFQLDCLKVFYFLLRLCNNHSVML